MPDTSAMHDRSLYDILLAEVLELVHSSFWLDELSATKSCGTIVLKFGVHTLVCMISDAKAEIEIHHTHRNSGGAVREIVRFDLAEPGSVEKFLRYLDDLNKNALNAKNKRPAAKSS